MTSAPAAPPHGRSAGRGRTPTVLVLIAALVLVGIGVWAVTAVDEEHTVPDATTYQLAARDLCRDLVRDEVGPALFAAEELTSRSVGGAVTTYTASGRARTVLGSHAFACSGTTAADVDATLRMHLDRLS